MSLIKQTSSAQLIGSPFAFRRPMADHDDGARLVSPLAQSSAAQTMPDQLDELETLRNMVRQLSEELEAAKADIKSVRTEATAQGYKKGLSDAATLENERSILLSQALQDGLTSLDQRLDDSRDLAIDLTLATLSSILGDPDKQMVLVVETASKWAEKLKSSKVLRARVSAADFGEDAALSSLCDRIGNIAIKVEQSLPSGSCLFDLELGHVDTSIPVQAQAAQDFLLKHANSPDTSR